jgi:hypothetical protein
VLFEFGSRGGTHCPCDLGQCLLEWGGQWAPDFAQSVSLITSSSPVWVAANLCRTFSMYHWQEVSIPPLWEVPRGHLGLTGHRCKMKCSSAGQEGSIPAPVGKCPEGLAGHLPGTSRRGRVEPFCNDELHFILQRCPVGALRARPKRGGNAARLPSRPAPHFSLVPRRAPFGHFPTRGCRTLLPI